MLLLIVVGALDVGSPVGILGCFDRHLFLLHSDVVNNKIRFPTSIKVGDNLLDTGLPTPCSVLPNSNEIVCPTESDFIVAEKLHMVDSV